MSAYLDEIFSKYQYSFRKGYSTQQCLLASLEKWKAAVDKDKSIWGFANWFIEGIWFSQSWTSCCEAKCVCVFTLPALKLVHDYLSHRKQRTRVNNSYSTLFEILFGVPQGSILGPLLFNIFLADLFFILNKIDIANYADDNTLYTSSNDVNGLLKSLEEASRVV